MPPRKRPESERFATAVLWAGPLDGTAVRFVIEPGGHLPDVYRAALRDARSWLPSAGAPVIPVASYRRRLLPDGGGVCDSAGRLIYDYQGQETST